MEQTITANGIELCYETFGDPKNPAVLFVMGLGGQMIAWPEDYLEAFATAGYFAIRYDNRDAGLSEKFEAAGVPDFEALIDHLMNNRRAIGGDRFVDDAASRQQTERAIDRQFYPVGTARQRAAIMASGARTQALGLLDLPTLVIHGDKDPLVPLAAGEHTAAVIPGARLEVMPGMGHAQYPSYQPRMIELMLGHVRACTDTV